MTVRLIVVLLLVAVLAACGIQSPTGLAPRSVAVGGSPVASLPFGANGKVFVSYNTGLQLGNYVLLYRATHRRSYLAAAERLAQTGWHYFGTLPYSLPPGNTVVFGRIYLRELATVAAYSPSTAIVYQRQRSAYASWVKSHPITGGKRYVRQFPSGLWSDANGARYSWLWPDEMIAASRLDHGDLKSTRGLRFYWDARRHGWDSATNGKRGLGDLYWDDSAWAAMDVYEAYRRSSERFLLKLLVASFPFFTSGWDRHFGGVHWVAANWNHDIAAVSTEGAEQVALDLYLTLHKRSYLNWALWAQQFVNRHLLGPGGLVYDHLTPCGKALCWQAPSPPGPTGGFSDPLLYIAASG